MNNTIPFHSAPHAPQITVDVNILTMLKQAASCLTEAAGRDVYLAAIGPDMELTIIMEEDAPSVLPCFDEDDALISVKGAPLFIADLPILPQKWQYLVSTSTKKQFGILQKLMHRPDVESVICATDAGQCGWVT